MSATALQSRGALHDAGWRERPAPRHPEIEPGTRRFEREVDDGILMVLVSHSDSGWHLSMSHRRRVTDALGRAIPGRNPTWEEIRDARYLFLPDDVTMALLLPPKAEYVNVMETCFHLWQV